MRRAKSGNADVEEIGSPLTAEALVDVLEAGALARAVVSGAVRLDGVEPPERLVASLTAMPGIGEATAREIAARL
jgi:hypothetical protein